MATHQGGWRRRSDQEGAAAQFNGTARSQSTGRFRSTATMRHMERLLRATALAERHHFWFRGFRRFVAPLLHQATKGVSAVRLLDCGCGTGANLELLGRFGRAYGFDLSELGLRLAREAGRTSIARATVTAAPFPSGRFDLVTSFDVLYSLEEWDERAAVGELFRVLKPGGFALVNVAAMPMLTGDHSVL